jgi:hypothetical protein
MTASFLSSAKIAPQSVFWGCLGVLSRQPHTPISGIFHGDFQRAKIGALEFSLEMCYRTKGFNLQRPKAQLYADKAQPIM